MSLSQHQATEKSRLDKTIAEVWLGNYSPLMVGF